MKNYFRFYKIIFLLVLFCASNIIQIHAQMFDLTSDLAFYMPVNGDASDKSGNEISSLVNGPVLTENRFGNPDQAYSFDGIDDFININNDKPIITGSTFTVCSWVKLNGPSLSETQSNTLFEQRDDNSLQVSTKAAIVFNIDRIGFIRLSLRSSNPITGNPQNTEHESVKDYDWHHYCARLEANKTITIFLDGLAIVTDTFKEDGDFTNSIDHVNIGSHQYRGGIRGALNGVVDEFRIYNRPLDNCEVFYLFSGTLPEER